nr:sugar ABC transporter substrate-binding protein [Streptomyces boncukensis]
MLAALAALPLGGAAATACSSGGGPDRAQARGGPARITFWSALRGSQEVVDAFNKSQDRVRVDFEQIPGGQQGGYAKLRNAARAGNAPDVATVEYPQVPGFAIDGVLRDLTPLISDRLRKAVLPAAFALTTFEKRTYSVPLDIEPMMLFYRRDLFRKHGIDLPRTWAEFEDAARTVRRKAPGKRLTTFPSDGGSRLAGFAWQANGQWFDTRNGAWEVSLADGPTRKVIAYWQRLVDEDLAFQNPIDTPVGVAQIAKSQVFTKMSGAWDAGGIMGSQPGQKGKWGVAPSPRWDAGNRQVGTHGGSTFAITKDSRNTEAAMEFIEWQVSHPDSLRARLSSGISSMYPAVAGLVPVARKAFDSGYYSGQDIYTLFEKEAEHVSDQWVWGPRMTSTVRTIEDGLARVEGGHGTILGAVEEAQRSTLSDLKSLGLATREG